MRKSPVTVLPFATTPLQIGHGSGGGFGEGQRCDRDATRNGAHSPTTVWGWESDHQVELQTSLK